MRQGLFGLLLGQFESQFGFLLRQPFWAGGREGLTFSLEPRVQGQIRRTGGS